MSADLVVFGEDWGRHPSSTQHLIRRLSWSRRVLWVNSIGMRRPRLSRSDLGRAWAKGRAMFRSNGQRGEMAPTPFPIVQPRAIPWPGNSLASWANGHLLAWSLLPKIKQLVMRRPILWTSLPTAIDVVGRLDERAVVYYAGDDFGALSGVDHEPLVAAERRLAARADLIIAASPAIAAKFDAPKTKVLPHGIDATFLEPVVQRPADLPPGPVAGFYGSLSDWLDMDLLHEVAGRLPDWQFVFIGDERTELSALKSRQNVHFLGQRAHHALPAYAQHWDVSLIPFRNTAQIRACNPLKLREYLACGRPIVATEFPALDGYRDHVTVAHSAAGFEQALRTLRPISSVSPVRQNVVAGETWDHRAREVADWLSVL